MVGEDKRSNFIDYFTINESTWKRTSLTTFLYIYYLDLLTETSFNLIYYLFVSRVYSSFDHRFGLSLESRTLGSSHDTET